MAIAVDWARQCLFIRSDCGRSLVFSFILLRAKEENGLSHIYNCRFPAYLLIPDKGLILNGIRKKSTSLEIATTLAIALISNNI